MRRSVEADADHPAAGQAGVARCTARSTDDDVIELENHGDLARISEVDRADRPRSTKDTLQRALLNRSQPRRHCRRLGACPASDRREGSQYDRNENAGQRSLDGRHPSDATERM